MREVRRDYEKHALAWRSSEQMLSPLYGLRPKDGKHCRLHTDFSLVPPNFLLHFISPGSSAAWRVEGTTNALRCLPTREDGLFFGFKKISHLCFIQRWDLFLFFYCFEFYFVLFACKFTYLIYIIFY